MKIALISNMNNNYFAMLRYLTDLGHDVKVFSLTDEHAVFDPENDSWAVEKWLGHMEKIDMSYYDPFHIEKANFKSIRQKLRPFDIVMGSGPSPAYLYRAGIRLDVFLPYKTGVEYTHFEYPFRHVFTTIQLMRFRRWQIKGLSQCRCILNADFRSITDDKIKSIGTKYIGTNVPLVYREEISEVKYPYDVEENVTRMKTSPFVVMHHGKHWWKEPHRSLAFIRGPFINNNANNWVINSFAKILKDKPEALLVLFEYGGQIDLSKALIKELGIEENVLWIKQSPRKHILEYIKYTHLGIGDLAVGFWGGKLYEFMSVGVPTVNSLDFDKEDYKQRTGIEAPPFLVANDEDQLLEQLKKLHSNESLREEIAKKSKDWFDKYDGKVLAKKIVSIFEGILEEKKDEV